MFKLLRRFIAYFIDMLVVIIIVQTISSIPFVNKNLDKYNDNYNDYIKYVEDYGRVDLEKYYEDESISNEEIDELISDNPNYEEIINKYAKINKKTYKKINKQIDEKYQNDYKKIYYKLDKYSQLYNISYIIIGLLYFVIFNLITDGVTLGKKITRLKIVNNKDNNSKVTVISYLIRFVLLYQPIYYLVRIIAINFLNPVNYYDVTNIVYTFHSYLEFVILIFIMIRLDGRGLHDILANTKVITQTKEKVIN